MASCQPWSRHWFLLARLNGGRNMKGVTLVCDTQVLWSHCLVLLMIVVLIKNSNVMHFLMIMTLMMTQCASYPVSSGSVAVLLRWVLWPSTLNPSQRILLTAHHQQHCDAFPYQIGPIIGPVRFTFRPRVDQHVHRLTVGLSRHWICRDRPIVMISYRVWQHLGSLDGEVAVPRDSPLHWLLRSFQ